jgi:hypothetical protein
MNKYIIASILSISLITVSCEDDDNSVNECAEITADFTSSMLAFNEFMENGTGDGEQLCKDYASSLEELIEEGCMTLSEIDMTQEEYEFIINGTFCSLLSIIN